MDDNFNEHNCVEQFSEMPAKFEVEESKTSIRFDADKEEGTLSKKERDLQEYMDQYPECFTDTKPPWRRAGQEENYSIRKDVLTKTILRSIRRFHIRNYQEFRKKYENSKEFKAENPSSTSDPSITDYVRFEFRHIIYDDTQPNIELIQPYQISLLQTSNFLSNIINPDYRPSSNKVRKQDTKFYILFKNLLKNFSMPKMQKVMQNMYFNVFFKDFIERHIKQMIKLDDTMNKNPEEYEFQAQFILDQIHEQLNTE